MTQSTLLTKNSQKASFRFHFLVEATIHAARTMTAIAGHCTRSSQSTCSCLHLTICYRFALCPGAPEVLQSRRALGRGHGHRFVKQVSIRANCSGVMGSFDGAVWHFTENFEIGQILHLRYDATAVQPISQNFLGVLPFQSWWIYRSGLCTIPADKHVDSRQDQSRQHGSDH